MKAALFLPLLTVGCFGIPTPLAPSVDGSVGVPHAGVLRGAEELPVRGPGFARLRPKSPNYWGNPRLVRGISAAARAVTEAAPGGAPLLVGDISAKRGGKIPGHRSHRTGRDVDLLFYLTTPSGASVPSPGFVKVATDGLSQVKDDHYLRLDVERNWILVRELVRSKEAQVQWLFASRSVEALLVDYARARGEPLDVIWRAETMLLEPGDSSPHDDHFHVRFACSADEEVAGCEGGGPRWEWLDTLPPLPDLDGRALGEIAKEDPFGLEAAHHATPALGSDG
ncbi:MAG: penicillin-insensitive murein endopeptidase [Polyangiaceae bacterium]|nr:penicillin-insensitive murein endopeptidase [Myxococcales bacterium]MCC6901118.1 penicillin-insensitive murein endopeptidase [Polyangiaceae bacterium]